MASGSASCYTVTKLSIVERLYVFLANDTRAFSRDRGGGRIGHGDRPQTMLLVLHLSTYSQMSELPLIAVYHDDCPSTGLRMGLRLGRSPLSRAPS
jgi:hypothetical protein